MYKSIALLAAAAAFSAGSHATTWSTSFDDATLTGSVLNPTDSMFTSAVSTGTIGVFSGDGALALPGASTASFSFSLLAPTPFFLVEFFASSNSGSASTVTVSLGGGSPADSLAVGGFAVPAASGPNPNPNGVQHSYYFGPQLGSFWAAGSYTLSFDNVPQAAGFRIDDVSVSAVPEPSSIALLLAGAGVLVASSRRRSKSR